MRLLSFVLAALVLAAALVPTAAPADAARRGMTEADLYHVRWVGDPRISPDGNQVAFVVTTADTLANGYRSRLWTVPATGGTPRPLTHGLHDLSPRWSPDGATVAFLRPGEDDDAPQLWLLPVTGGEAQPLTRQAGGVGAFLWSPNGRWIAFTSAAPVTVPGREETTPGSAFPGGWESDAYVITRPDFKTNGGGLKDPDRHARIWVIPAAGGAPRALTRDPFDDRLVGWSAASDRVFFASDRRAAPWREQPDRDLYGVAVDGGDPELVLDLPGRFDAGSRGPSDRWAFTGRVNPPRAGSYVQEDLFTAPAAAPGEAIAFTEVRNETALYDSDMGPGVATDMSTPAGGGWGNLPVWSGDGKWIYVITSEWGTSNLMRVRAGRDEIEPVTTGRHSVMNFSADRRARRFALLLADGTTLPDIWTCDERGRDLLRVTAFNDDLLATKYLSGLEELSYLSEDGTPIQGWVMKPVPYDPWKKHPLVVQIHGGPHFAYGHNFMHEFQVLAARGHTVFFCNPRGSTTYGRAFADQIQYQWPGGDVHDILAGVDSLVARGGIRTRRMGVTGGSGGGYLTGWIIVKDHRFAAAAMQRTVSDWLSFYWSSDMTMYTPFWFREQPWENPMEYVERSPAYFAPRVRTPLLILHAERDYRTPLSQAEAMFRALQGLDKEAVLVVFPDEDHNLSRRGSPHRRVDRLRHLAAWFDYKLLDNGRGIFPPPGR